MENSLRTTIIKLQNDVELHFQKVTKYNKFGCKALFSDPFTKTNYDIMVLSKGLLHLNKYREQLQTSIKRYKCMNSKIISPINSLTEDGDIIYIVSDAEKYKLSDLVQKREGLTEFQCLYFALNMMEIVNYLKSRNCFYQIIELDEIYLSSQMKITVPFSLWITYFDGGRFVPIRHEDKKKAICPEIIQNSKIKTSIDEINSWNMGVFLYELIENRKPSKVGKQVEFSKIVSKDLATLIAKLLQNDPKNRLKYQLIFVQDFFKKFKSLPHILPETIFSCPPSSDYIEQYQEKFVGSEYEDEEIVSEKVKNVKTTLNLEHEFKEDDNLVRNIRTFKYIKPSERSLTESQSFIYDFVDISHAYGYGYQMNTGVICFVFNDRTSMYFEDQSKKTVAYINQKKQLHEYPYEKFPQEGEIKKKLFVLEAYTKSIKKFRQKAQISEKIIIANEYLRTNYAAVFLLSNMNIQIYFNDKMSILLTKSSIYVQAKNSDRFQPYETILQASELSIRKKYSLVIANKFFHWDVSCLEKMKGKELNTKNISSRGQVQGETDYWYQ